MLAPEVASTLPRLVSDTLVQQTTVTLAMLLATRPELTANPGGPLREIFVAREGGMRIVQHLLLRQSKTRGRFLQAAPLSRADLSRNHGISRTHINRLLAEAEAAGVLSLDGPNRVVFSPAFSDEVEAYIAGMLQVNRLVVRSLAA
jgi:CRP-like cAMP-binding protein